MSRPPAGLPSASRAVIAMATATAAGLSTLRDAILREELRRAGDDGSVVLLTAGAYVVAVHEETCRLLGLDPGVTSFLPPPEPHEPLKASARRFVRAMLDDDLDLVVHLGGTLPAAPVARALVRELVAVLAVAAAVERVTLEERLQLLALRSTAIG